MATKRKRAASSVVAVEASVFAAGLPLDAGAALLIELDGLDRAFSFLFLSQLEPDLLFALWPGHQQFLVFTLQQSEEEIL